MCDEGESGKQVYYEIKVRGALDERWQGWFNGALISVEQAPDESTMTTLICYDMDQAKLRGILNKIWDLNLVLISVNRVDRKGARNEIALSVSN